MGFANKNNLRLISQYLFAALMVTGTSLILRVLQNQLGNQGIALIYLVPVVVCARLWGLGPGITAAVVAFFSFNYLFTQPYFTFQVHHSQDIIALIVFLLIAVVISQLLGHDQESIAAANQREQEATRLYELSVDLAGLSDLNEIARVLAEKTCQTFAVENIQVVIQDKDHADAIKYNLSNPNVSPLKKPDMVTPIATARGQQGVIQIWRKSVQLTRAEERLLNTFASQGALAIERAKLAQNENRARVLEQSDQLKSALLSSVSHELRSPLATIKASISSLRSGTVDWESEARQDLLIAIEEETDLMNQLVGNLLDMSRIETGALKPQRKWNSLPEIVNSVLKYMRQNTTQHKIKLDMPEVLPLVPVDYLQIEQVFSNLISNSLKYAPSSSIIGISARLQPDQMVHVQVSNQGPHVAPENLERIFDKFYRVTSADKITGTGLGLSICKGIIEAHGGKIWAENAPDQFVFHFTLPISWQGSLPHMPEESA